MTKLRRGVTRVKYRCDLCCRTVQRGERHCMMGPFESCRECEPELPARYQRWLDTALARRPLKADDVRTIREMAAEGVRYVDIAEKVGTNQTSVMHIVLGRTYTDIS